MNGVLEKSLMVSLSAIQPQAATVSGNYQSEEMGASGCEGSSCSGSCSGHCGDSCSDCCGWQDRM